MLNVYSFPALAGAAFIWDIYLLREANYRFNEKKLIVALMALPLVIEGIIALLSPFFGFFFDISATNVYARGFLFPIHSVISFGYLFIGILIIILQRKNLPQNEIIPMVLFAIPPLFGGIFQMLFYGVLLINPALSLSVLMIFIFNQSRRVVTDYLTGLSNRRSYDKYLQSVRPKIAHQSLGGMLIDLDGFKAINDTYGHFYGDEVLIAISTILQDTFDANDFIARTGGDEFFIFFKVDDKRTLAKVIKDFLSALDDFNQKRHFPFPIKCSYGIDVFDINVHANLRKFVAEVDKLMYRQKGDEYGQKIT
jgi:diguanylate cyclase (GGDEF)-like protein